MYTRGHRTPWCCRIPPARREQARTAFFRVILACFHGDALFFKPSGKLLEREHTVHIRAFVGLCLFRDARPDENGLQFRVFLLQHLTVRLHRRQNMCKVRQSLRVILLHKRIDRVAACGNDDALPTLFNNLFVFGLDDGRTYGGLLYPVKAKLFERRTHRFDGRARVICYKGWRKADCHGTFTLDEHLRNRYVISDFFCVLRTYDKALTAENALVFYDMRLTGLKTNGLDRAMTDALITVLTVRLFELQVVWHTLLSSL